MNKYKISTVFLLSLALLTPTILARGGGHGGGGHGGGHGGYGHGGYGHGGYGHGGYGYGRGYGYGGGWVAPAIVGTALTGAAIAASNQPSTVVVEQSDNTNQVENLQRENRDLRNQNKQLKKQKEKLERKAAD